jgi:hypothetical protein
MIQSKSLIKLFSLVLLLTATVTTKKTNAQIVVNNAEKYVPGTHIIYKNIITTETDTGASGPNVEWDYSDVVSGGDSTLIRFVSPQTFGYNEEFGSLSFVEVSSDSSYVFVKATDTSSQLAAFKSVNNQLEMTYPNHQTFMVRPLEYLTKHHSPFTVKYSANGYHFSGSGQTSISVDGYGTLLLPGNRNKEVLRIRISQTQFDTLEISNTVYTSQSVSYLWFDGLHPEPLLRISRYSSSAGTFYSGGYTVFSNTASTQVNKELNGKIFPNPTHNKLHVSTSGFESNGTYTLHDLQGKTMVSGMFHKNLFEIDLSQFNAGVYFLTLTSNDRSNSIFKRIVVE